MHTYLTKLILVSVSVAETQGYKIFIFSLSTISL